MALKSTGMVREIDGLGRIVIPMELRKTMDIKPKDPLEIYFSNGDMIVVNQYDENAENASTSITRDVDSLGRIVIPKELRKILGIEPKTPLEIYVDGKSIILKKYSPACIFCDSASDVVNYCDKKVCRECIDKLSKL